MKIPRNQTPPRIIQERGGNSFAELGSLTAAMKAQEVLAAAAIPSTVEKIEFPSSHRGCVYGLRISAMQEKNARAVLTSARISVKRWNTDR
ncbi:MAG: hypothetical protein J6Q82_06895 [Clostridia bacterium]|nr:hypothetical protein [Clostridia bacterium]